MQTKIFYNCKENTKKFQTNQTKPITTSKNYNNKSSLYKINIINSILIMKNYKLLKKSK